jgi:hypothetical protein
VSFCPQFNGAKRLPAHFTCLPGSQISTVPSSPHHKLPEEVMISLLCFAHCAERRADANGLGTILPPPRSESPLSKAVCLLALLCRCSLMIPYHRSSSRQVAWCAPPNFHGVFSFALPLSCSVFYLFSHLIRTPYLFLRIPHPTYISHAIRSMDAAIII